MRRSAFVLPELALDLLEHAEQEFGIGRIQLQPTDQSPDIVLDRCLGARFDVIARAKCLDQHIRKPFELTRSRGIGKRSAGAPPAGCNLCKFCLCWMGKGTASPMPIRPPRIAGL